MGFPLTISWVALVFSVLVFPLKFSWVALLLSFYFVESFGRFHLAGRFHNYFNSRMLFFSFSTFLFAFCALFINDIGLVDLCFENFDIFYQFVHSRLPHFYKTVVL